MRLKINPELLENAIKNATRDHPRVRRISPDVFGVRCTKQCNLGREHEVVFTEDNGLWVECVDCISSRWGKRVCRHAAACIPLFIYYRGVQAA